MDIRLLNTNGRLNGVNLKLPNSRSKPKTKNHRTTIKISKHNQFHHYGYLEKMMIVNLDSKEQSLQAFMIKPILWFFYSFSQTHMRLFLSNKIQIQWTDLDWGFWGLLCFLSIILMYKRENLTDGSKDLGEFGFLAKKTTVGRRVVLMNGLGSSSLALELVLECCRG